MTNLVREDVKSARLQELQDLISEQYFDFNKASVGKTMSVLFERKGKKEGQLQGRTPFYQAINVPANERLLGEFVDVSITSATANALVGEIEMIENIANSA
jgi:tRNA-2-methylthio-N6-dimethylallyladenosine synthase